MTPAELQAWRQQQGLSQPALAELLHVHAMTISSWETGRRSIPPYLDLALAYLRLTVDNRIDR